MPWGDQPMATIDELARKEIKMWLDTYSPLAAKEERNLFERYNHAVTILANHAFVPEIKKQFGVKIREKKLDEPIATYLMEISPRLKIPYNSLFNLFWRCKGALPEEEKLLVQEGEKIREELFVHDLRLVARIVGGFPIFTGMDCDDLFQEGVIALGKAIDHFNPTKDARFATFAFFWIHEEIKRRYLSYSSLHGGINFGRDLSKQWEHLAKYLEQKSKDGNALPNGDWGDFPIQEKETSPDNWDEEIIPIVTSLDDPLPDGNLREEFDQTLREVADPEDLLWNAYRREIIQKILSTLTEKERQVIMLYFGFDGEECIGNLAKVGVRLNITRQRASQLLKQALRKIRKHPLTRHLKED